VRITLLALFAFAFVSCSDKKPETPERRTYSVTFAAALVPDSDLAEFGGSFSPQKGYDFETIEGRYRLAERVLQNPERYPVFRQDGAWVPLAVTGGDSRMRMKPKAADDVFMLEKTGMTLDRFSPSIRVDAENDSGQIECAWGCEWGVTLKEPVGNSNSQGGSRPGGAMLLSGKPDMTPLCNFGGKTLWMIVGLKRE